MNELSQLLANNKAWSERISRSNPDFFKQLATAQSPNFLWIGCSDSRVPANEIIGLLPGEIFVHRNIANLVVQTDFNCMAVIAYAVEVLKVEHIIVCGHYGCGGVRAAMEQSPHGLIDNWLHSVRSLYYRNKNRMVKLDTMDERYNLLCELNAMQQVKNVSYSHVVQRAWAEGRSLTIHGWIYSLHDGLLKDLGNRISSLEDLAEEYRMLSTPE